MNAASLRAAPSASESDSVPCYPKPIMEWSSRIYRHALQPSGLSNLLLPASHPEGAFALQENDYCFGAKKFGGNAQSITRQRFCHHTSFLWDFDEARMMRYLKMPGMPASSFLSFSPRFKVSHVSRLQKRRRNTAPAGRIWTFCANSRTRTRTMARPHQTIF